MLEVRLHGLRGLTLLSPVGHYLPTVSVTVGADVSAMAAVRLAEPVTKAASLALSKVFYFAVPWPLDAPSAQSTRVHVQVFDHDDAANAFRIGEVLFPLATFARGAVSSWYPLLNGSGEIHLSFLPASGVLSSQSSPALAQHPLGHAGLAASASAQLPLTHAAAARPSNPLAQSAPTLLKSQPPRRSDDESDDEQEQRPAIRHVATRLFRHEHVLPQRALSVYKAEEIVREYPHIAKGGFGVVFKGRVAEHGALTVVIKDQDVQDEHSVEDWRREVELMQQLRSPHVADIFGYSSTPTTLTIVMEYFPHGDLFSVLHKKADKHPLSMLQRMRMARHCALGLAHLHSMRIMHRDVKSMNILVTEDYACKLTDFGCSKLLGARAHAAQMELQTKGVGSPLWMAPEVRASEQYGFPGDVFSLGLVLYEIFEKKLPQYDKMELRAVVPAKFNSAPMVLPCLHASPTRRPSAAAVVKFVDSMIRNVLAAVCAQLPPAEQSAIAASFTQSTTMRGRHRRSDSSGSAQSSEEPSPGREASRDKEREKEREKDKSSGDEGDETSAMWAAVYAHLLTRPAAEVDALINQAFTQPQVQAQQMPKEKDRERDKDRERERERDGKERERERERDKERNRDKERDRGKERDKDKDKERKQRDLQPPSSPPKLKARSRDGSPTRVNANAPTSAPLSAADARAPRSRSPSPSAVRVLPAQSAAKPLRHASASTPAAEVHVAWVDNDISSREHEGSCTVLRRECAGVRLTSLRSTAEALTWLRALSASGSGSGSGSGGGSGGRRALIITSRFRQHDGGEQAAAQLVAALRKDSAGREVPVLIYCGNKLKVLDLTQQDARVKAADEFSAVVAFVRAAQH